MQPKKFQHLPEESLRFIFKILVELSKHGLVAPEEWCEWLQANDIQIEINPAIRYEAFHPDDIGLVRIVHQWVTEYRIRRSDLHHLNICPRSFKVLTLRFLSANKINLIWTIDLVRRFDGEVMYE